jgi:hypothetical protein
VAGEVYSLPAEIISVGQAKPVENVDEETEKVAASITHEFKIDPEFRRLIPPLDAATKEELKLSLQRDGCRDKLTVCKLDGECVLLDGHSRYDICKENEPRIPFETTEITVSDRTEAKIWIIKNQRGRRNLNESQRAMLAVALKDLYAEEAKLRQGTRTDLGKDLDERETGRSAEKAGDDMGISHQTVIFAEKVAKKGIPELAGLVNSGKVAVSAAAKATTLSADLQHKVAAKAEERIRDNKHANIAAIIREISPKSLENDAEERFKKSKKNLAACLKLLDGIEATQSQDKLAEMLELLGKLTARLNEIGAKPPDQTSQNEPLSPDDLQTEIKGDSSEPNSDSSESTCDEDADVLNDDEELANDSLHSAERFADMPDGWEEYQEAIESEYEDPVEV